MLSIFAFLGACAVGNAAEIVAGMGEAELLVRLGKPTGRMTTGNRSILQWRDFSVTLENGKVTQVPHQLRQIPRPASATPVELDIDGFRDVQWGDELAKTPGFTQLAGTDASGVGNWIRKSDRLAIGEMTLTDIVYTTFEGKLASIMITPAPSVSRAELIALLKAKYGEPTFASRDSASWRYPWIEAMIVGGRTSSFITIASPKLARQMEQAKP